MDLTKKIFAISGAGSGLGKAVTDLLTSEGAYIIALDIKVDNEVLDSWEDKNILFINCDVRSADQMNQAIKSGVVHFGGLHGGVSCAGIAPACKIHSSRSGSHPYDDFANTIAINLNGTFNLFNSVVPYLKNNNSNLPDGERGILIGTSSVAAFEGQIGQAAYAASKGGVTSMVLPLARELARNGIRVNAIAPGIFKTPMVEGFPAEVQNKLEEEVPFPHRLGRPEEFAALVKHIITNRYINGTVIRLDGSVRMSM